MKHTQGPWTVTQLNSGTVDVEHSGNGMRSRIRWLHVELLAEEHGGNIESNARLISAAPDLLAALQSIAITAGLCAITFPNAPGNGDLQAIVREARAAIAKATNN